MDRKSQSAHSRLNASGVLEQLGPGVSEANLYRFCQLLERAVPGSAPLGSSASPADDPVRFKPHRGLAFAASELHSLEYPPGHPARPATVRTWLLGLYGVDSPLPSDYVEDIAQGVEGHEALEAFLDIFNHRIFTQFYRIWRKYSYPASFEAGGRDATSRCLLGLVGLGIPGTASHIATPVSRFLALLGVMRLPTRNAEGVGALVDLLAPGTGVAVQAHQPLPMRLVPAPSLSQAHPVILGDGIPIGGEGLDVNSQILVQLFTDDRAQARGWLPGQPLHSDLLVLLRVYLGWRCSARLQLHLPLRCLPLPIIGAPGLLLGMTAVLGLSDHAARHPEHASIRIELGSYHGLAAPLSLIKEVEHVHY